MPSLPSHEAADKTCSKCGEAKPLSEFHKDRTKPDGLRTVCKTCTLEQMRQYREENPEIIRNRKREYNAANKDKIDAYNRRYYRENREDVIKRVRRYYRANRKRIYKKTRQYLQQNPEVAASARIRYRARKKGAEGTHTPEQLAARIEYYGGRCYMCGEEADTVDHVIPLSNGGTDWPANLRPACHTCNCKKSDKSWRKFISYNGGE